MPGQSAMLPAGQASAVVRVWEACEQGEALLAVLFPYLSGLRVHRAEDTGEAVVIWASCRAEVACCPRCGHAALSSRRLEIAKLKPQIRVRSQRRLHQSSHSGT